MRLYFFSIALFFIQLAGSYAQEKPCFFSHHTTQNGLSNNWVRSIVKDQTGFIWLGTADGLNRFDGYDFKVFRPTDSKGRSLGDIHVNAILQRNGNALWICTDIGVYALDLQIQDTLKALMLGRSVVLCAIEGADGNVWFGTSKGLYKFQSSDSSLSHYTCHGDVSSNLTHNYINALFEDAESNLWIGTKNGLKYFDKRSHEIVSLKEAAVHNTLTGKDIAAICEDPLKGLWIGTSQDGLYLIQNNINKNEAIKQVVPGSITSLLTDYEGNIWVGLGTDEGLLKIYRAEQNRIAFKNRLYRHNRADVNSISDNSVFCLYEDDLKDIWIGTVDGGINYFSKREKSFYTIKPGMESEIGIKNELVNAFLEEGDNFWIGTDGRLIRYAWESGKITHYQYQSNNPKSLGGDNVFAILKDTRNNLWVGAWSGGLNLFNEKTGTFQRFLSGENVNSLSSNNVISLHEDRKGNLWVGTQGGGVNKYDYNKGAFSRYIHQVNKPGTLYHESVNKILETRSGKLYFSTYFSLDQYDYQRDSFYHYIYNPVGNSFGSKIISLFEDSRSHIWVATNQGLVIFNEDRKAFESYFADSSFLDNVVQDILEDAKGHLWISTNNGLYKIIHGTQRPVNPDFIRFSAADGLSDNEFTKRAAYKNSKGMMYFGSSKGFTYFHPDSIVLNTQEPQVVLTEFQLLNTQPDLRNKFQPIPGNINSTSTINLNYRNADFIIRFAALNYLHTEKNRYQYRLEGYDEQWIDAGTERTATYTNIQPGKYTFMVIGSNNDGIWNEAPKMLRIIVHPPWWNTLFFNIVLAVTAIFLIYLLYLIRVNFLKRQNRYLELKVKARTKLISEMNAILEEKQEEIVAQNNELETHRNHLELLVEKRTHELVRAKLKAEESDRLKSSFLANISHEIRTPMNAIYGFASLLKDRNLTKKEESNYLDIVNTNCESLLVLIDDLLDISMIEADQLKITKAYFEANTVLAELENQLILKHKSNVDIVFTKKHNDRPLLIYNDKTRFIQIFTNLLNNALKYTEQGHIHFGFEDRDQETVFFVSDTGIGIDPDQIGKVFDQFYKIENGTNKYYRGTGIGLTICEKLISLMDGKIGVESEVNKGSKFFFTLPKSKENTLMATEESSENRKMLWLKGLTILIAEDDPTNYKLLQAMLKNSGAKIYWAQDGQEAISYIKNKSTDEKCLVLMDIKMPVVDGFEAKRQIKLIDENIPIIAVTAYAQVADKERIMNNRFDGYIAKPFNLDTLIKTLSEYVKI